MYHRRLTPLLVLLLIASACDSEPTLLAPEETTPLAEAGLSTLIEAPPLFQNPSAPPGGLARVALGTDGTVVLDFEEFAGPTNVSMGAYSGGGYSIVLSDPPAGDPYGGHPGSFAAINASSPYYTGSTSLLINDVRGLSAILTKEDGRAFAFRSIDVAPFFTWWPADVTLIGTKPDGTEVAHHVLVPAGSGAMTVVPAGFSQVVEVRWQQVYPGGVHHFDNVVLGPADPTSLEDCLEGGWDRFGFSNQGQCVRFVRTGGDSR